MEGGVTLSTGDTSTKVLFLLQCTCINPLIQVYCSNFPCIRVLRARLHVIIIFCALDRGKLTIVSIVAQVGTCTVH
jgi:hypothetical protein